MAHPAFPAIYHCWFGGPARWFDVGAASWFSLSIPSHQLLSNIIPTVRSLISNLSDFGHKCHTSGSLTFIILLLLLNLDLSNIIPALRSLIHFLMEFNIQCHTCESLTSF